MVVRAVVDGLLGVVRQSAGHIHPDEPREGFGLPEIGRLVKGSGPRRELLPPDLRRRGDESRQPAEIVQILFRPAAVGHLGDEGVAAEIDPVELPFAQQVLIAGLEPHPAVPQGELVSQVLPQPLSLAS